MGFRERLREPTPIVLDGATGTELARRGVDISGPMWSAKAIKANADVLRDVHSDYVAVGAELITANTFRTNVRAAGKDARTLTKKAVTIALEAAAPWVAGSVATIEDCYRPDLVPPDDQALREHKQHAYNLSDAGVSVILIETMNTIREAKVALAAALMSDVPAMVSFVTGPDSKLLSGEPLEDAVRAIDAMKPDAILVNCVPAEAIAGLLLRLKSATSRPIGAYANILASGTSPDLYARFATEWLKLGAKIVGGCCGTTPDHIRAVAAALREGG